MCVSLCESTDNQSRQLSGQEATARQVLNYFDHFNADGDEADVLFRQTLRYIEDFGWFQRKDGADHVFLFSWGRHPCRISDWRLGVHSAVQLQVEDRSQEFAARETRSQNPSGR